MLMELTVISGTANLPLAEAIATQLGAPLGRRVVQRFPDSELRIEIEDSVRGHDVYLLQSTSPPADAHLFELFLLARMQELPLARVVVTDSVPSTLMAESPLQRQSLKTILADVIRRLHRRESLSDLLVHR
jgi:phosphoribosylpyrophosphate synthetase